MEMGNTKDKFALVEKYGRISKEHLGEVITGSRTCSRISQ